MWRAIIAFSMVDTVLSLEKQKLLQPYLSFTPFSRRQRSILKKAFTTPQDIGALYKNITAREDKVLFKVLTHALSLCNEPSEIPDDSSYEQYLKAVMPPTTAPYVRIYV